MLKLEILPVVKGDYQLKNYDEEVSTFNWDDVKKQFSWYENKKMNIAYEAIDRHASTYRKNKVALYYKNYDLKHVYTYNDLKILTNQAANVLRSFSTLKKGDRLFIFMPRSPELYFALFGALKMGVIVGPLYESFMKDALFERLFDSEAKAIVTTTELAQRIPFEKLPHLETIFLVGDNIDESIKGHVDFNKHLKSASKQFTIEWMEEDDATLLHYTSTSAGKPRGIVLAQKAMIQQYETTRTVLDLTDQDIYWCTADPGWITGTVYGVIGPMLAGATTLTIEESFTPESWYEAIEQYGVTVWYSAPTAFRMLMGAGEKMMKDYDFSSLRHILSVGEPLNEEVIKWGRRVFNLRIHDTWFMTETGAHIIANFKSLPIKIGAMGKAVPGIEVAIIDQQGNVLPPNTMGNLAIKKGWPAMMKTIWQREELMHSYFINDEWYISGDSAYMDEDGYFWFQGRINDVIMTSGERIGPFDIETKLVEHEAIAEAGVIGKPDPVVGERIKAFIVLNDGYTASDELIEEIQQFVKKELSVNAAPEEIEFKEFLPKTRSGKIIRKELKVWEAESTKE